MSKFQHDVMLRVVKVLDVLMIELPFAACWFLYYSEHVYTRGGWKDDAALLVLFFILYIMIGRIYDAFSMSNQRVSEMVYGQILGAMATDGIMYIVICLMSGKCDLPYVRKAVQPLAGNCCDCRTAYYGNGLGNACK